MPQGGAREVDARVPLEESKDPLHVALCALLAGNGKDAPELLPLIGGALAQGVDEHERALALPDVAEDLLAVLSLIANQVQDVVLDLERRAEQEPNRLKRSASIAPAVPISAPMRQGWMHVYQHVFLRTSRR